MGNHGDAEMTVWRNAYGGEFLRGQGRLTESVVSMFRRGDVAERGKNVPC
jgi:hypothetical protein